MAKHKLLPVAVTDREKWQGFLYLVFQLCFLPSLLYWFNGLLKVPISTGWLNFLYFTLNFLFICGIFHGFFRKCLRHAGNHIDDFLIAAVAGFGVYYLVNLLLGICIQALVPGYANLNDNNIAQITTDHRTIMTLATVLFVPVAEETLHRGLIFGTLYRQHKTLAYIASAVLFAGIHVAGYLQAYSTAALAAAFVQYLPAGFILAWAYRKSGSIFAPILIHIAVNTIGIWAMR